MLHRRSTFLWLLAVGVTSAFCLAGCFNPRNTPAFKKMVEEQEKRAAKYTEEALQKTPDLQELDRLCTKEIPIYEGFVLRNKDASSPRRTYMGYSYDSGADYRKVKSFYVDYFTQNGWKLVKQYDGGWGPKSVEFKKDSYWVIIYHGGMDDVEYAIHCEKLSDSGEELPNNAMQPTANQR